MHLMHAGVPRTRSGLGGNDADADDRLDAGHDPHVDLVVAERLDRLAEVEGVTVEVDPLAADVLADLVAGHGAEETPALAGLDRDLELQLAELLGRRLRLGARR